MTTKHQSPVLDALFALEDHIRGLPLERRDIAITLATSRLRRLHSRAQPEDQRNPYSAQLDFERYLAPDKKNP